MQIAVQPFTVGPILGAVSPTTARLWGRGPEVRSGGELRRVFGVARLKPKNGAFGATQYFKLNPNFDLTGVTVFHHLTADTEYTYQIGAIVTDNDAEFDGIKNLSLQWDNAHSAAFRTASSDPAAERCFVFGSCRYLLRLFGGSLFDDRGDKTFRSINEQIEGRKRIDQILMLGDQIYADDLNFFLPDQSVDEYYKRYRDVFSQEHFRRLVGHVPTYMTLDDHEIEDNWPAQATGRDYMRKFPAAMHSYLTYQLSHSPLFSFDPADGRLVEPPERYWYQFADGCCEFFVMDTRTERFYDDAGERIRIIKPSQMSALKDWLADGSGRVKLVATSVPFFPDLEGAGRDRWDSFPLQRNEILEHIRHNKIKRVVFLSGDVHSSMSAELRHAQDAEFKVVSIVSSPFYWPYPHSSAGDFQVTGELTGAAGYRIRRATPIHSTDSFTRVTVNTTQVRAEFFKRKGDRLSGKNHSF